jgi:hypothetical protein
MPTYYFCLSKTQRIKSSKQVNIADLLPLWCYNPTIAPAIPKAKAEQRKCTGGKAIQHKRTNVSQRL